MEAGILTVNAGSSSLKVAVHRRLGRDLSPVVTGTVESIETAPHFQGRDSHGAVIEEKTWAGSVAGFEAIVNFVIDWAERHVGGMALDAVGHRVVHGGREHIAPERVTDALMLELEALTPLAPLHQPHNLAPIRAIASARPGLPQVVCFDTAFHATLPPRATRFALPRRYDDAGVRRYGFHGLSYEFVARRLADISPETSAGRVVAAHLGAGASLCAMVGGRSLETTMGFTTLDGLMMGTRCGAIDPGVILYLMRQEGMSVDAVESLLYRDSGLFGVSGLTSDMRVLLASDVPTARDAIDLFVYRIVQETCALAGALGGLDGLVFTAGVGEHAAEIRSRVCGQLAWLGVVLDADANAANATNISAPNSPVQVLVIPTDEEATIARHTLDVLRRDPGSTERS